MLICTHFKLSGQIDYMAKIIWGAASILHCVLIYWCALLCFHPHREVRQKELKERLQHQTTADFIQYTVKFSSDGTLKKASKNKFEDAFSKLLSHISVAVSTGRKCLQCSFMKHHVCIRHWLSVPGGTRRVPSPATCSITVELFEFWVWLCSPWPEAIWAGFQVPPISLLKPGLNVTPSWQQLYLNRPSQPVPAMPRNASEGVLSSLRSNRNAWCL